jgi:two-component system NtrC family sensor kinase
VASESAKTILVLSNNSRHRKSAREMLERHDYRVYEASNAGEAARLADSHVLDLILFFSSQIEPDELDAIQRLHDSSDAGLLMVLADNNDGNSLPAADVLRPDFSEPELVGRCRGLLALKSARDELNTLKGMVEGRVAERTEVLELALRGQGDMLSEAREARRIWEATFNSINDAIAITDIDGRITLASARAAQVFGRQPEDLIGEHCDALMAGGYLCPHEESLGNHNLVEREVPSRAGNRLLNVRVSNFADADDRPTGFVHVFRDVTEQRAIERQLMHVERMTLAGKLVSAVAHEVATPLSVIANIAEMLLLEGEPASNAKELRKITTEARRITEMMRGLLNFVRQAPSQFTGVDLALLARETLELMSYELRKRGIDFSVEADTVMPTVRGDSVQLQQVVLNLLTNAMQAMKEGGHLWIRLHPVSGGGNDKGAVALVVEDTGPGIAEAALARLFDYFFTTRGSEGGTGLGLAITRQIVEGHGGQIEAENIAGGGARFVVTLPAALPEQRPGIRAV